jgi:cellulose synthase/poly-beta-1,6-N-acetylglucosamine synthase-like glycosyltransferase
MGQTSSSSPATIAVIIASKNGERTIGRTVRSAAEQADTFVVSDGSTDNTVVEAAKAGAYTLELAENVGKSHAVREGFEHFKILERYDAVMILDDDSLMERGFIEAAAEAMTEDVDIVTGKITTLWKKAHRWNFWLGARALSYWITQTFFRPGQSALNVINCVCGTTSVFRSTLLQELLPKGMPYVTDDLYWTLETQRMRQERKKAQRKGKWTERIPGKIVYTKKAEVHTMDPLTMKDFYKQNLRWMHGSFQGLWGHKVGRRLSLFDAFTSLLFLDAFVYLLGPAIGFGISGQIFGGNYAGLAMLFLVTYSLVGGIGGLALNKPQIFFMTPMVIVTSVLLRVCFLHALVKAIRQPTVESSAWSSPERY